MTASKHILEHSLKRVVVFQTHELSEETLQAYRHLKRSAGSRYQVELLLDVRSGTTVPPELLSETVCFDSREFASWGLPVMGDTMLPGHCHFPILRYFLANPAIEMLWHVEYDVRFTGAWNLLFDTHESNEADLLCCHLQNRLDEPQWYWWGSLRGPTSDAPIEALRNPDRQWRALLVVSRYSARALRTLVEYQRNGWSGHQEVLIPTVLTQAGLKVRDLNGRAVNCEQLRPRRRSFYWSTSDLTGSMSEFGSIRFRPASLRPGLLSNTLYHPVKPKSMLQKKSLISRVFSKLLAARQILRAMIYRRSRQVN
ncbi:MAG: hypothetical protein JO006_10975 [Paucibacter sp.]|nr:hypothetical protein [Roseateles sp.]